MATPRPPRPPRPTSRRRLWAFRLIMAVVVPALLLITLELALRLAGVGYSASFFAPVPGNPAALMPNPRFGWRFFPHEIARRPEPFVLPIAKPASTVRIFVLGSSAAQGFPDPALGLSRVLEVMLREAYPGVSFEVVNAAMVAINSHVVVDIARDCAARSPDAFIVYEGNNEVIGPFGPGTAFAGYAPARSAIRAGLAVKRLRTAQMLDALLRSRAPGADLKEWTGMELFLKSKVPADDPRLVGTADHFRANLADICSAATRANAKVLLCTVGVNLRDCPPFASLHTPTLAPADLQRFDAALAAAAAAESTRQWDSALPHLRAAIAVDGRSAEAHFRLGRALAATGKDADALAAYAKARDLDALRFRTDSALNAVIREVAASAGPGVTLVDIDKRMQSPELSARGVPGAEMFLEHCHMTFAGNYQIARALFEALSSPQSGSALAGLARAAPGGSSPPTPPAPPTMDRCAELLGLTPLHQANTADAVVTLMERPPFTLQINHESMLADARADAGALRARATPAALRGWVPRIEAQTARWPRDADLRRQFLTLLGALGDLPAAEREARALLAILPFDVDARNTLAGLLLARQDAAGAIAEYQKALDSPWSNKRHRSETFFSIGVAEEKRSRADAAAERYQQAIDADPRNLKALGNLGLLRSRQGRHAEAETLLRKAVAADPAVLTSRVNLVLVLIAQGRHEDALKELQAAATLHPADASLRVGVADLQAHLGRAAEAIHNYEDAVRIAPNSADARTKLGAAYLKAGRKPEAEAQFLEALRINPDSAPAKAGLAAARK